MVGGVTIVQDEVSRELPFRSIFEDKGHRLVTQLAIYRDRRKAIPTANLHIPENCKG